MDGDCPPGWGVFDGVLVPDVRVAAHAARGQSVKGICNHGGCRRSLTLDPEKLCRQGLGQLAMRDVQQLARCQLIGGCSMDFHAQPAERPLRLEQLVGKPNVKVRLRCRGDGCRFFRVHLVEAIIEGLVWRRQGNGLLEVEALAGKLTSACPRCGKVNWAVEIVWSGRDPAGYKTDRDRTLERLARR